MVLDDRHGLTEPLTIVTQPGSEKDMSMKGRVVGFVLLFALSFGSSILPAQEVRGTSSEAKRNQRENAPQIFAMSEPKVEEVLAQALPNIVQIVRIRRRSESRIQAHLFRENPKLIPHLQEDLLNVVPQEMGLGVVWDNAGSIVSLYRILDDPKENDYYVCGFSVDQSIAHPIPAKVIAGDPFSDLAVLRVESFSNFQAIPRNRQTTLEQASPIVHLSIHSSFRWTQMLRGSGGVVVRSSVSPNATTTQELDQKLLKDDFPQYGALFEFKSKHATFPGGGICLNRKGEWVGMTTAPRFSDTTSPSPSFADQEGLFTGYGIPIDSSLDRLIDSLKGGKLPSYGFLGIQAEDLPTNDQKEHSKGALVVHVVRGMPADLAGVREGDILIELDQTSILDRNGLYRELARKEPDSVISLVVARRMGTPEGKQLRTLHAKLSKKHIATRRPPYSQDEATPWRGLLVEYASALPQELLRFPSREVVAAGAHRVVAIAVAPDSACWRAGIRPGNTILEIDGKSISSPREFMTRVEQFKEQVARIRLISSQDQIITVEVGVP